MRCRPRLELDVQGGDARGWHRVAPPEKRRCRRHGADHYLDLVRLRDLDHGHEVVDDLFVGHRPGVFGDIIRAGEDQHGGGLERHHVLMKPQQHLGRGLAADAAPDIAVVGEKAGSLPDPRLSDGVAHEHHPRTVLGRRRQGRVVGLVEGEGRPVARDGCGPRRGRSRVTGTACGGWRGNSRRRSDGRCARRLCACRRGRHSRDRRQGKWSGFVFGATKKHAQHVRRAHSKRTDLVRGQVDVVGLNHWKCLFGRGNLVERDPDAGGRHHPVNESHGRQRWSLDARCEVDRVEVQSRLHRLRIGGRPVR